MKRPKIGYQCQLSLTAGQKYCRMGAFCNTFDLIRLPFVIKIFVLSIFEWPFDTDFAVYETHYFDKMYTHMEFHENTPF